MKNKTSPYSGYLMLDDQPLQNLVAQNNIFLLSFMVLRACFPSEAGITWRLFLTWLAPCWDHWLASLSPHNLSTQVSWASSQHGGLRVVRLLTPQLASPGASVLIHREWSRLLKPGPRKLAQSHFCRTLYNNTVIRHTQIEREGGTEPTSQEKNWIWRQY